MTIKIDNPSGESGWLSIPKEAWLQAIKEQKLTFSEFCLYLYLASNPHKEIIHLDRKMFEDDTGYKKTSYHDGLRSLQDKGYLIQIAENSYRFSVTPQSINEPYQEKMFGES